MINTHPRIAQHTRQLTQTHGKHPFASGTTEDRGLNGGFDLLSLVHAESMRFPLLEFTTTNAQQRGARRFEHRPSRP